MISKRKQSFLQDQCEKHGFDLLHSFHTSWYNDLIEKEGHVQSGTLNKLPCPHFSPPIPVTKEEGEQSISSSNESSRKSNNCNAFLIGNTKTIWPFFIQWLLSEERDDEQQQRNNSTHNDNRKDLLLKKNPFDAFCDEMIRDIVENFFHSFPHDNATCFDIFLSSGKRYKIIPSEGGTGATTTNSKKKLKVVDGVDSFLVSMQRVATLTGKYWYDDVGSKLCVHPEYGTWHAFRGVVIISDEKSSSSGYQPIVSPPPPATCPVTKGDIDDCKKMMEYALRMSSSSDSDASIADGMKMINSLEISSGTKTRLIENLALQEVSDKVTATTLGWIGLRDSISLGRDKYRYDDEQICYHYTRDVQILTKAVLAKR